MAKSRKERRLARRASRKVDRKQRDAVLKAERTPATPETLAKLRPCPLKQMLQRGVIDPRDPAGMQPNEYEAALQIWEAHDALVRRQKAGTLDMNKIARGNDDMSDGKARLIAIYLAWGAEVMRLYWLQSDVVVGWIDDHEPAARMINDTQRRMLVKACRVWEKMMQDFDKERRASRNANAGMLTEAMS